MKKIFLFFVVLILSLIGITYTLLFTSTGNTFLASQIESKVNEGQRDVNVKVKDLKLTLNEILFHVSVDKNSSILIQGKFNLFEQTVNLTYDINIKDLSRLQNITKQKLNGSFATKGSIKGNKELAIIQGISSIASSKTSYNVKLVDFKPSNINFVMLNAKIEKLLHLVNQPLYAKGDLNINAKIKNANIEHLDGVVLTTIANTVINNTLINKQFNQKLKETLIVNANIKTDLVPNKAKSKIKLLTSIANVYTKNTIYDIKKQSLFSDYILNIPSLSKLFDITQTKMRGQLDINGTVKQSKNNLEVKALSKLFDGNMDVLLHNNKLKANIKDIQVRKLIHTLYYPEFFNSLANLNLNYNLVSQKGILDANLTKGKFLTSEYSSLINMFAKFDLTKEIYNHVVLKSDINKNIIKTSVNMSSKHTNISVEDSLIDTKLNTIKALVKTQIKAIKFDTKVSGLLTEPKIKLDAKNLFKNKVKDELMNKLSKKLKIGSLSNKKSSSQIKDELMNKLSKKLNSSSKEESSNKLDKKALAKELQNLFN